MILVEVAALVDAELADPQTSQVSGFHSAPREHVVKLHKWLANKQSTTVTLRAVMCIMCKHFAVMVDATAVVAD